MPPSPAGFDAPTRRILPSARVCRVHLFRHAEVVGAGDRLCRGHSDVGLSTRGAEQTAAASARWPGPYDVVFSSDLQRCTALATQLGPITRTPRLREQDMGRWDGCSWKELTERDPAGTTAYWKDYLHARPPGGESYSEVYERVNAWWRETEPTLSDTANIAVVTHIGCIRSLLCAWTGMPPGEALRWAPGYATHGEVLLAEAGAVIVSFGEAPR